ncbi:hypothetical protein SprV_0200881400 [Sparganum proliferum]
MLHCTSLLEEALTAQSSAKRIAGTAVVGPHVLTLPLQLTGGEDNVGGSTITAEAALIFRQDTFFQLMVQAAKENASEDHPGGVHQGDATTIVAELVVTFPLVEMGDCSVLEILRDLFLTPHRLEKRP